MENKWHGILTHRIALNIYFWVAFLLIPWVVSMGEHDHDHANMRALLFFAVYYASIVYTNNLVLMPKLFDQKHYLPYFSVLFLAVVVWSIIPVENHNLFYGCHCIIHLDTESLATASFQTGCFVVIFGAFKVIRDFQHKENHYKVQEQVRLENELDLLKGQISPHFLFNTLNSLYAFALEKSSKMPEVVLMLSNMLRYMLYETKEKYVSLSKEVDYLKDYVALQEIRLEGRGNVSFHVHGAASGYKIAPAMLINFVENCFKHGLAESDADFEIQIVLRIEEGVLNFATQNNYEPREEEGASSQSQGIGLENVKKRLERMYPHAYQLSHSQDDRYYYAELNINLEER